MDQTNLVLKMLPGEDVIINEGIDEIVVTFVGWHGKSIKVAFTGPADIPIDRRKVRESKQQVARVQHGD